MAALSACTGPRPDRDRLSDAPLATRMAAADPRYGAQIFGTCAACHNDAQGAGDRDGPNLWGVVGAPVAALRPSFGYTAALRAVGGTWTCGKLDRWLTDPARFAPGTLMTFPGLKNGQDRADVIAYLATRGPRRRGAICQ